MNALDKQTEYFKIIINHEYFQGENPIDVMIENNFETQKYDFKIQRIENTWIFYGRELLHQDFNREFNKINIVFNSIVEKPITIRNKRNVVQNQKNKEEKDAKVKIDEQHLIPLKIVIMPQSHLFYYVTSTVKINTSQYIPIYSKEELYSEITDLEIQFKSIEKHFEYAFIVNDHQKNYKLIDTHGIINFQTIINDNDNQQIRFISENKIQLTSIFNNQINLIEITKYGEKVILNNLKIPEPTSISNADPYHAITAYYSI